MNQILALEVLKALMLEGTEEFCICPGARNSPLVDLLLQIPSIKRYQFFEERSAAFFAIGRIKATQKPVAVVTTSGTAAGELLPATMEAYYSSLPLVLVTADRPQRFRGTGAPQTAEQVGLYGVYVEKCLDLGQEASGNLKQLGALADWSQAKPFHLNVCFEEPLLDHSAADAVRSFVNAPQKPKLGRSKKTALAEDMRTKELSNFLKSTKRPLVVVGGLHPDDRAQTRDFLCQLGAPVYFEAPSGLREDADLAQFRVHSAENILGRAKKADYPIDGVLRLGSVPTLRLWRDLEALGGKLPVFSISREPFSGLSWAPVSQYPVGRYLEALKLNSKEIPQDVSAVNAAEAFLDQDLELQKKARALFFEEPRAEASLFHLLSRAIPVGSRVYLGNSMPIREWDLAATFAPRSFEVAARRGLNGIDGQVSTFYGFSGEKVENWAVLGDLTALYDLPGPWALSEISSQIKTRLVVMNNGGGKIFSRMFPHKEFQNPHRLEFSAWAKLWRLTYEQWFAVPDQISQSAPHQIIEILPDEGATKRFWEEYDLLFK